MNGSETVLDDEAVTGLIKKITEENYELNCLRLPYETSVAWNSIIDDLIGSAG